MLEAKAKDQGQRRQVFSKKEKKSQFFLIFQAIFKKKILKTFIQAIYKILTIQKNSAVVEPRTGQFSKT